MLCQTSRWYVSLRVPDTPRPRRTIVLLENKLAGSSRLKQTYWNKDDITAEGYLCWSGTLKLVAGQTVLVGPRPCKTVANSRRGTQATENRTDLVELPEVGSFYEFDSGIVLVAVVDSVLSRVVPTVLNGDCFPRVLCGLP